jgi:TPR repeat protein
MTGIAVHTVDWVCVKLGVGSWGDNSEKIWKVIHKWDYAQANDDLILGDEPQAERMNKALALYESDQEAGFQECLALAEEGSVWCMGKVAWSYFRGQGVSADISRAEEWYRRGFEGGSTRFLLDYAALLLKRDGFDAAESAFRSAAADGWPPALFWLAWCRIKRSNTRQALVQVRPLLERAAAHGSPGAQWFLAHNMAHGRFGLREVPRGFWRYWKWTGRIFPEINRARDCSGGQLRVR